MNTGRILCVALLGGSLGGCAIDPNLLGGYGGYQPGYQSGYYSAPYYQPAPAPYWSGTPGYVVTYSAPVGGHENHRHDHDRDHDHDHGWGGR